ncbi:MAG: hypothetical protein WC501_02030 [Candidatus Micrarchaeia archaeon]
MVFVGFIQKFFHKENKQKGDEFKEQMEEQIKTGKKIDPDEFKSKNFDNFIKDAETQKKIREWMNKWNYKKRGLMALLYILWLQGTSNKNVLRQASDILSKLKGEDIFAKFLNVLKLKPEGKMK